MINFDINNYYNEIKKKYNINQSSFSGLVIGDLGIALYEMFKYIVTGKEEHNIDMFKYLNASIEKCKEELTFGNGLVGITCLISLMRKNNLLESEANEWLKEANFILKKEYYLMLKKDNIEYFYGAGGILFYFIHSDFNEREMVQDFIYHIKNKLKQNNWKQQVLQPQGHIIESINMGVPHGITGILLLMLQIKEKGISEVDEIIHLLIDKMLEYKLEGYPYFFPAIIETGKNYKDSKTGLAWCYGDLSTGYAILKAGMFLGNNGYILEGTKILNVTIQRTDCRENDFTFCHGYPSIYYIYYKIYLLTKNTMFLTASNEWVSRAKERFSALYDNYLTTGIKPSILNDGSLFLGFPGFFLSILLLEFEEKIWNDFLLL